MDSQGDSDDSRPARDSPSMASDKGEVLGKSYSVKGIVEEDEVSSRASGDSRGRSGGTKGRARAASPTSISEQETYSYDDDRARRGAGTQGRRARTGGRDTDRHPDDASAYSRGSYSQRDSYGADDATNSVSDVPAGRGRGGGRGGGRGDVRDSRSGSVATGTYSGEEFYNDDGYDDEADSRGGSGTAPTATDSVTDTYSRGSYFTDSLQYDRRQPSRNDRERRGPAYGDDDASSYGGDGRGGRTRGRGQDGARGREVRERDRHGGGGGRYDDRQREKSRTGRGGREGSPYRGDLSEWGRTNVPQDKISSESDYTMSSGLSPRNSIPREREFDVEQAKKTLAYNAGLFGKAQAMRREGTAPAVLGIADDLPTRFAFQQLTQLAGMASKVQNAIEHNRKIFEARLKTENMALQQKVFSAWRAARYGSLAKQQLLRKAMARIQRGTLSRAFQAWKDKFHLVDKYLLMRRKVAATIARGRVKRVFYAWQDLCEERWWKNQLAARDSTIHALERKIDGFERRPIIVLRKRKQSAILYAWWMMSEERRKRRMRLEKAMKHWQNGAVAKAWNVWAEVMATKKRHEGLLAKAARRIQNQKLNAAWQKWVELLMERYERQAKMNKAYRLWANTAMGKGWNCWRHWIERKKYVTKVAMRWMKPMQARSFYAWCDWVSWSKRMKHVLDMTGRRIKNRLLAMAWDTWAGHVESKKMGLHLSTKEQLEVEVRSLREQNERLLRDNERFVRLIDSGEWGRGRVAELAGAGEVLKGERDALFKLIQSLRREYEAVQQAKAAQDGELRALKEKIMLGGAARNRMLVKGGSSFNALVRAMKQDLVEATAPLTAAQQQQQQHAQHAQHGVGAGGGTGMPRPVSSGGGGGGGERFRGGPAAAAAAMSGAGGAAARDPNLIYEVDRLSMDRVTVFPDGELRVEALASGPGSAAFARPVSAGRGLRASGPPQPSRVPQGLPALPSAIGAADPQRRSMGHSLGGGAAPQSPLRAPAGGPVGASGGGGGGRPSSGGVRADDVMRYLQSLSPAELDSVEAAFRAERMAAGPGGSAGAGGGGGGAAVARPPGVASSAPSRRGGE